MGQKKRSALSGFLQRRVGLPERLPLASGLQVSGRTLGVSSASFTVSFAATLACRGRVVRLEDFDVAAVRPISLRVDVPFRQALCVDVDLGPDVSP